MNEEQNNEQQEVQDSKLKQTVGRVGKQVVREAERQVANKLKEAIAKAIKEAIAKLISVLGVKGLIVLAILAAVTIGIVAIDNLLDEEVASDIEEVTNNAMDEYCTIDEYGVHFDKEKFIETLPKRLKEEIGIDFNDLGLGLIMVDPTGYFFLNPDSQAAEYLYKYMAAALSSELPYIEGSDEETKGIIKIKRTLNNTKYSGSTLQPSAEPTDTPVTKTINTSKFGLTPENVKITMDNIKNEYKIAWVSDLHMMHPDQPTINTTWYSDHGTTFEQRNSTFNNSYLILDRIIDCLKENDFDAIVFGGDIMDNYSDKNLEYLKRKLDTISDKKIMFLVADHDYLTEMTTNSGENTSASSIGEGGDIKKITIGKDGDSINLVGQNYSNKQISDGNVSTIDSYINETSNSLFFTHVPVESKTQASSMQAWSKSAHNGQVYYWSKEASSDGYKNPSESYLNTLYSSSSLKGVFAGHVHSSGDFELNTGIKEHIFRASFNNSIGVITLTPSGAGQTTPVEIIEDSNNTEEIELKYIGYSQLQDMINSDDVNVKKQSLRYFSLDSSWNLCITKWRSSSTNGVETSFEVSEVKIPYRRMVSQYTIPFTFLMDLQLISQNANYVEAVSKLMTDRSFIDFTIFDSVTTDETTYTYEATAHTKKKHMEFNPTTMQSYETGDYDETTSQEGPDVTVTKIETDSIKASVTKAKTWIIDQTITYNLQESREYPYGAEPGKVEESSEPEPSGEGSWRDPIKETWYEEIIKREWVKGAVETKFMPDEFLGLWSNKTGKYVKGASYTTTRAGGKLVEYNTLEGSRTEKPVENIIPSREQLYGLLEQNQTTQIHGETMKEIINFYLSGEELTEDTFADFDFISIFEPSEFVEGSYVGGDFDVHDESLFITDLETLKRAFQGGYSKSEKLVENAQAFLDMQQKYKVNAIFAASVSITETGAGTAGNAIAYTGGTNPRTGKVWQAVGSYNGEKWNNWFDVKTNSKTHYGIIHNGEGEGHYKIYSSIAESIDGFGYNIAEGSYYYKEGRYTVASMGERMCPNCDAYPTQMEDWIAATLAQITKFYNAIGKDISSETSPGNYSGEVIRYYQNDYANVPYGSSTISKSGCGPTSFAMVATTLTGRTITPRDIIAWCGGSYYIKGSGTAWGFFSAAARHYGFSCTQTNNFSQVEDALKNGKLVISSQSKGLFTNGGHFILLTKMENGLIYVNDPNKNNAVNKGYNNRGFTTSEIRQAAKSYWIFE